MLLKKFEPEIYAQLNEVFSPRSYELVKDLRQFRCYRPQGFQNIIISGSEYQDEVWLDINLGVRMEVVEEAVQQFLSDVSEEYRPHTNTVIVSVSKMVNTKYFIYKIEEKEDIGLVAGQIGQFMNEQGFAFLDYSIQLRNLDRMFNEYPKLPLKFIYNQVHRCFKGAIIARLADNPRFLDLVETYEGILHQMKVPGKTLKNYRRLVNNLLHFMVN